MISASDWRKIKDIIEKALELEAFQRNQYLDSVCEQGEIRQKVEELILAYQSTSTKTLDNNHHPNTLPMFEKASKLEAEVLPTQKLTNATFNLKDNNEGVPTALFKEQPADTLPETRVLPQQTEQISTSVTKQETVKPSKKNQKDFKDSLVGTYINQYYVEKFIAQGRQAIVYRVRHKLLNKVMAMKVLLKSEKRLDHFTRFIREAKAAQKINHPNLVQIHEIGKTDQNIHYLTMEYIEGVTLKEAMEEKLSNNERFSIYEVYSLISPILDVLTIAHSKGIIHRDIKPENIILSKDINGNVVVKLIDLGLVKTLSSATPSVESLVKITQEGQHIGTPIYMSPEQWGLMPKDATLEQYEIDPRSDIYSIGILMYELIAGSPPFYSNNLFELFQQHGFSLEKPLNEISSDITKEFAAVIAKAMAKDRTDRYSSAKELASALKEALESYTKNNKNLPTNLFENVFRKIKGIFQSDK